MSSSGPSSAEVQREAEAERAELVRTLDQLRENLKPANVVDEVMASAKVSTTDISDKIWQTARANPLPATFIALGAAMIAGGKKAVGARSPAGVGASPDRLSQANQTRGSLRGSADMWASPTRPGDRFAAHLREAGNRAAASASQVATSARTLRREADRSGATVSSSARKGIERPSRVNAMDYAYRSRTSLPSSLSRLIDEQPLILAAVGVAIGAAIGAAIPSTEAESRLMGDASQSLRSRAQDLAQAEVAHLKSTASSAFDQLKQNAADHGLSADNLNSLVQDSGSTVQSAVRDATDHAAGTAGLKT